MFKLTQKNYYILGIESSCDDTAAAVIHNGQVLSNVVATQKIHEEYGGVVPELASRAHQQNIVPVVDQALKKANIKKSKLILVTAISPTPAGEGKTTMAIGLTQGMNKIGKKNSYWIKT